MPTPVQSISLICQEGTSDKVYRASVEANAGGYVVNFAYGRRGSKLRLGTKTTTPIPRVDADRIYNEVIADKLASGYVPDVGSSEIDVVKQTREGRLLTRDFASALQDELWAREYGHSWGVREEFAKIVEDHPELLNLQIPEAADTVLRNLSTWSPDLAEKEAKARSRYVSPADAERTRERLEALMRAIKTKTRVGPEIAKVYVCSFGDDFTASLGKPNLRAVLHDGQLIEVLESEEAAVERAKILVARITEIAARRTERSRSEATGS